MIDPALFDPSAISDEIRAQNAEIVAKLSALPDPTTVPPAVVRERRRQGLGPFPPMPLSQRVQTIAIDGPGGPIPLRIIAPENPRGIYFHIHGGGWNTGLPPNIPIRRRPTIARRRPSGSSARRRAGSARRACSSAASRPARTCPP
jgi:acetyl esterase/lipase